MTQDFVDHDQPTALLHEQRRAYEALLERGLSLDLTRGKPSAEQLDLSLGLLALPGADHFRSADGTDCRNYGGLQGLAEIREIFSDLLGIPASQLIAGNNSSLSMMHDSLTYALLHGVVGSERPWASEERIVFVCPVPGYDRHFALLESLGIAMVTVPMNDDGPDVDAVAEIVRSDRQVKGMWLVPTYANPTGSICTPEVAARLASMTTAATDFRIFWDNAYAVHHLTELETKSAEIVSLAAAGQNPDRAFVFASTSKITFAGAGVGFFGGSPANVAWYLSHLSKGSIGPDKLNHLRHATFLRDADGVRALMARHREVLAPKFDVVSSVLAERLGGRGVATWTDPKGGYFVSLDVVEGTAGRVVELAKAAGISLTPAGASFPYGNDPADRNIRIAPTFPSLGDLRTAMEGLATCVLLAAAERSLR